MNHREFIEPTSPLVCIVVLFLLIMILHNCNVELTKVHYRDDDRGISIISRSDPLFVPPKNTLIKKNIFGHTWILKINESDDDFKKSKTKIVAYTLIFGSIVTVVFFGIFFSIDTSWFSAKSFGDAPVNTSKVDVQKEVNVSARGLCQCENNEVCLKVIENELPRCEQIVDKKDPTGCGGLCKVNEEYCKRIQSFIYQCRSVTKLNCSGQLFNCGNRCIPMKMRCDGVINCSNKLDEKNCNCDLKTHFQCGNVTSCLILNKRCDGKVDCWDRFDEIDCTRTCPQNKVPCRNGQCIKKENFCDGIHQCADKSDEFQGCTIYK